MNLTLGEEDALTEQTVTETLERVTEEIKKEESNKYRMERAAHQETQEQLAEQRTIKKLVQEAPVLALPTASHSVRVVCFDNHCRTAYWRSCRWCWFTIKTIQS